MSRDPRKDPRCGDEVCWADEIIHRVIDRNRNYVTASNGRFTLYFKLGHWRELAGGARIIKLAEAE